jgi:hypothetical protein
MVKYLSFHNSSFCLKILFTVSGKATSVTHTPCSYKCESLVHEFQYAKVGGFGFLALPDR